jgi:hypothetical protein
VTLLHWEELCTEVRKEVSVELTHLEISLPFLEPRFTLESHTLVSKYAASKAQNLWGTQPHMSSDTQCSHPSDGRNLVRE